MSARHFAPYLLEQQAFAIVALGMLIDVQFNMDIGFLLHHSMTGDATPLLLKGLGFAPSFGGVEIELGVLCAAIWLNGWGNPDSYVMATLSAGLGDLGEAFDCNKA